jgi:hypothetical protein
MGFLSRLADGSHGERAKWLWRWVVPRPGPEDQETEEIKRAAAYEVSEMEAEDRKYFRHDGPGDREDDL